ncbi:MAG: DUF4263 domain-containing protein [Desulfobacteraceae bacterium]|nr:DUF4263 domain-containing protein [Desulfobacteraceae bacterium]MBC2754066.1 DUF4263 domain-containing protein [Desulfobacteraceae bacterium]
MTDDHEYFFKKRPDRVYLSKSLENKSFRKTDEGAIEEITLPFRIVSKVIDCEESHKFIKDGKEVSLRVTPGGRQEIKAKFYEDTRGIFTLQIQRYTVETGIPHNTYFTFVGSEISTLYNFIRNIPVLPVKTKARTKLDDRFMDEIVLSKEQALQLINDQPDLIREIIENQVTCEDIANLGYRRSQLEIFQRLLADTEFFNESKIQLGKNKRDEDVWQQFFERNSWIFGYGLNYFFNSPLEGKKLEQVVRGSYVAGAGKRVDALLKTQGIVSSLSFGEIKTHKTNLIESVKAPYRKECWKVSEELTGGIAQIQKTVQISLQNIQTKTQIKGDSGDLTGEELFLYHPKAFLVIGSLSQFKGEYGINEEKYSSFELFRRNIHSPEIITFDELYERAKYIVISAQQEVEKA